MAAGSKSGSSILLRLELVDLMAKAVGLAALHVNGALKLSKLLAGLAGARLGGVDRNIPEL